MHFNKLNPMQLSDYESRAIERFYQTIQEGKWTNNGIVQLIELAGSILNLQTVPDYSKAMSISDRAARNPTKTREIIEVFNVSFVIDNE